MKRFDGYPENDRMPRMPDQTKVIPNVTISALSSEGLGIARIDGKVIFVEKALPGDVTDIRIYKRKKKFDIAKVTRLIHSSEERRQAFCEHFGICGGCKWQNLAYARQLHYKHQIVQDAFLRIAKVDIPTIPEVIGCNDLKYFRNKLEYTFSNNRWLTDKDEGVEKSDLNLNALGFHIPKMFDKILNIENCYLQPEPSNSIRNAVKQYADQNKLTFFNIRKKRGLLRNLIIRTSSSGEVLVLVSCYVDERKKILGLLDHLKTRFPKITSLQYVINGKVNETIHDLEVVTYHGRPFIYEQLGGCRFKIGPKSFFQTNTAQARVLYDLVNDFAGLSGHETVLDLYCGVGSIAIYLAEYCRQIIGIEQVDEAVNDARENAGLSNVSNATFIGGDVRKVLTEAFYREYGTPGLIITDPPRGGMHPEVVGTILQSNAPKIIYVSCNPATQARDLQLMSDRYKVTKIQPIDLFPHTVHVENVVLLEQITPDSV